MPCCSHTEWQTPPLIHSGNVQSATLSVSTYQGVLNHLEQSQHAFAVIYPSDWQVQLFLEGLHHALPLLCT